MNREKSREIISTKQLFAILFTLLVGRGLIVLPTLVAKRAQQDGWISIMISGVLSWVLMNLLLFVMQYFEGKTFIEISEFALGKYLGKLPSMLLLFYYLVFAALTIRVVVDLTDTWLLPRTPIEILIISILGLCYYLCRNGLKILGRFDQALLWVVLPIFPLFILPFVQHRNMLMFLPMGGAGFANILQASLPSFYAFLGFECIILLYPYARKNASHRDIVKTCNIAMSLVVIFKVFVVVACIAVYGHIELQYFIYPVLEYFKLITFPVIERVEFVMVYFWLFIFFGSIVGLFKLVTVGIERLFRVNGYKNISLILTLPAYYITRIPQNVPEVFEVIESFSTYSFIGVVALLTFVFTIALIRRRRNQG